VRCLEGNGRRCRKGFSLRAVEGGPDRLLAQRAHLLDAAGQYLCGRPGWPSPRDRSSGV